MLPVHFSCIINISLISSREPGALRPPSLKRTRVEPSPPGEPQQDLGPPHLCLTHTGSRLGSTNHLPFPASTRPIYGTFLCADQDISKHGGTRSPHVIRQAAARCLRLVVTAAKTPSSSSWRARPKGSSGGSRRGQAPPRWRSWRRAQRAQHIQRVQRGQWGQRTACFDSRREPKRSARRWSRGHR